MKLSLLWLGEHIDTGSHLQTVSNSAVDIVHRLGQSTVEVEQSESICIQLSSFTMVRYQEQAAGEDLVFSYEDQKTYRIPGRQGAIAACWYLLYRHGGRVRYATVADLNGAQETLLPSFYLAEEESAPGSWRQACEPLDVRLSIDNKAITHRADLWSHRGFAREIAYLMGWRLKSMEEMQGRSLKSIIKRVPYPELMLQTEACTQAAFAHLTVMPGRGSIPWMAIRLARIDARPLQALVDITNYVMYDMGQPLHVFDAERIQGRLVFKNALQGDLLLLLDGTTCSLSSADCIVADEVGPLSLAGIKGGKDSGVSHKSSLIVLEGARFSSDAIRSASRRHKLRTDASIRAAKGIDGAQLCDALIRYYALAHAEQIVQQDEIRIEVAGEMPALLESIYLSHKLVQDKIGDRVTEQQVIETLTGIGCQVTVELGSYQVQPPSWRAGDIKIVEDLIEEIARLSGYGSFKQTLPERITGLTQSAGVQLTRAIKRHLAYGLGMHEVVHYPFYDEEFLQRMALEIEAPLEVKNPVSSQWRRLVTSLVPHLIKDVHNNSPDEHTIKLFEIANIWTLRAGGTFREHKQSAFILYSAHEPVNFYSGKSAVTSLLHLVRIAVNWQVPQLPLEPWWDSTQCGVLEHNGEIIGKAGMIAPPLSKGLPQSALFAVELDCEYLLRYTPPQQLYKVPSKYPSMSMDISILAPLSSTVTEVQKIIQSSDIRIERVELIDMFSKEEWGSERALTFRYTCVDYMRTMTRQDADLIMHAVQKGVESYGAKVR